MNPEIRKFLLSSIVSYTNKLRAIDYNENHPQFKEWMDGAKLWYEKLINIKEKYNKK